MQQKKHKPRGFSMLFGSHIEVLHEKPTNVRLQNDELNDTSRLSAENIASCQE